MKVFSQSSDPNSLGSKFRSKRMHAFLELLEGLPKPVKILDLGGKEQTWVAAGLHDNSNYNITLLNLSEQEVKSSNISSVAGDGTNLPEFEENHFDLVFSNSVIEHLYTFENQEKMANEIQRVGQYYFVQTPNKYFFIEPHYLFPYFQFLPKKMRFKILTKTKFSRGKKWEPKFAQQYIDEIRLLSLKEMKGLFPNCKVLKEKFMLGNKSFIVHNLPDLA